MTNRNAATRFSSAILLVGVLLAPMIVRAEVEPESVRSQADTDAAEEAADGPEDVVDNAVVPFESVDGTIDDGEARDDDTLPESSIVGHRLVVGAATAATAAVVTVAAVALAFALPYVLTDDAEGASLASDAGAVFFTTLFFAPFVIAVSAGSVALAMGGVWSGVLAAVAAPVGLVGGTVFGIGAGFAIGGLVGAALVAAEGKVDDQRRDQLMGAGVGYGALIGLVGGTLGGTAIASGLAAALPASGDGPLSE